MFLNKTVSGPAVVLAASLLGGAGALTTLWMQQQQESVRRLQANQQELASSLANQLSVTLGGALERADAIPLADMPHDHREAADRWLASRPEVAGIFGATSVIALDPEGSILASTGAEEVRSHHGGDGLMLCASCLSSDRTLVIRSQPDLHGCRLEARVSVTSLSDEFVQPLAGGSGYAWLLGPERTIVAGPQRSHIGTRPFTGALDSALHAMLVDMEAGGTGIAAYQWEGQDRLAGYAPVEVEGQPLSVAVSADADQISTFGTWWRIGAVLLVVLCSAGASVWVMRRTERRRFEERLRLQQAAAHADRLATLGTLSAGLAHELRGPLSALVMGIDVLSESLDDPMLDDMEEAADRLTRLTRDMTGFSRSQGAEARCVPAQAVQTALRIGATRLRRVDVQDRTAGLPPVRMQRQRLEQVVLNLAVNAADAMNGRGTLILSGHVHEGVVHLRVQDDGPGVAPEVRDRLFQAFATTKADGDGTGLGLFLCQQLVQEAGGTMSLVPTARGTCFEVSLPVSPTLAEDGMRRPSRPGRETAATAHPLHPPAPPGRSDVPRSSTG